MLRSDGHYRPNLFVKGGAITLLAADWTRYTPNWPRINANAGPLRHSSPENYDRAGSCGGNKLCCVWCGCADFFPVCFCINLQAQSLRLDVVRLCGGAQGEKCF